MKRGQGLGGTSNAIRAVEVKAAHAETTKLKSPPKAHASAPRPNPPNTELRRQYERSDLPLSIIHGSKPQLNWRVDVSKLDYHHYLPIFFSGLREVEEPYRIVAEQGVSDMISRGSAESILPVVPQLILPIKEALATRDERVIVRTLRALQQLVAVGGGIGETLVPYYRQILPVLNIFVGRQTNMGDAMDFGQRKGHIGELIQDTLQKLELSGGPDAYVNLRYLIPTYESCIVL
jgi:hypothetical protein